MDQMSEGDMFAKGQLWLECNLRSKSKLSPLLKFDSIWSDVFSLASIKDILDELVARLASHYRLEEKHLADRLISADFSCHRRK